jgi:hypothetical protein
MTIFWWEILNPSEIENTAKKESPRSSRILNRRNPASRRVVRSTLMTLRQEEKKGNPLMWLKEF